MAEKTLVKLSEFAKLFEPPPHRNTLLAWCRKGLIPAKKIGIWYVDLAQMEEDEHSEEREIERLVQLVLNDSGRD